MTGTRPPSCLTPRQPTIYVTDFPYETLLGFEPGTTPGASRPANHWAMATWYNFSVTWGKLTIFLFLRKTLTRRFLVVPDVIVEFAPLLTSLPFGIEETDADSRMLDIDGSETLRGTPFWKRTTRPVKKRFQDCSELVDFTRLYFDSGKIGLNHWTKTYLVVTWFLQQRRPKGIENLFNLNYMPARLNISQCKPENQSVAFYVSPIVYQTSVSLYLLWSNSLFLIC